MLADWIAGNYAAFASTGVRRAAEPENRRWRTLSLLQLLEDLRQHTKWVTFAAARRRLKRVGLGGEARRLFSLIAGGSVVAARRALLRDIRLLRRGTSSVKRFVDKQVAHTELDSRRMRPTSFGAIRSAVETIEMIWSRWSLILAGEMAADLDRLVLSVQPLMRELLDRLWQPHRA
jgi:hypothetical protein